MKITRRQLRNLIAEVISQDTGLQDDDPDTDDDHSLSAEEIGIMLQKIKADRLAGKADAPGVLTPEDLEKSKAWIAQYISNWFNHVAFEYRHLTRPENKQSLADKLVHSLRAGASGVPGNPYLAVPDFNKALRLDNIIPKEHQEHFSDLVSRLADAIEQDATLADPSKIGKKGDWHSIVADVAEV